VISRGGLLAAVLLLTACQTAEPAANAHNDYANFLIGEVANRREDHQAAAQRYNNALARSPQDAALVEGAVIAALATGDIARARMVVRRAGRQPSSTAHLVRAADALAARRLRDANADIEAVSGGAVQELSAGMLLAWVRTGEGRVDEILVDLRTLGQVRPYGGLFAYQQAMALDYAGRNDEALEAYALGDESGLWLPAGVERHADLLARLGRRDEAITLLRSTEGRIGDPALVGALARVRAGGRASSANLTPAEGAAVSLHGLASIFLQEHDTTNGLMTLSLALMLDPDLDPAKLAFANTQSTLGQADAARRMLALVSPQSPYAANARVMQALVLFREGRREEALAMAQVNAAIGPRGQRALADMYRGLERWSDAEAIYTRLLGENARDWRLHFARGVARDQMHRWDEAENDLRHALELEPDQPDVLNYLGYTWADRGENLDEALAMIQRAVEQRPRSGAMIDSLGWVHYRRGDFDQAIEFLERAVELEPASAVVNDHLGDAYWRADRRIEARFQWQRALALAEGENRTTIAQKLETGLGDASPTRSATR
jgi:tetratricopeptide (TPR) repeat protein